MRRHYPHAFIPTPYADDECNYAMHFTGSSAYSLEGLLHLLVALARLNGVPPTELCSGVWEMHDATQMVFTPDDEPAHDE